MNEQIQAILAQEGTKTSKIQQLLILGLTRREVANLVANGNYGFVQNVYARMQRSTAPQQTIAATQRELDYTFNRKFGVEIEAMGCTTSRLQTALRMAGIEVEREGYNHTTRSHWKIVSDASLRGENTFELVSPILFGQNGLDELEKVTWVLDELGVKVNKSCGIHVHFDASEFNLQTWKNLLVTYTSLEQTIDSFMPESRRHNQYCQSLRSLTSARHIDAASSLAELSNLYRTRYTKVNLQSYTRHKTVEFRQHGGSISFTKISQWILFLNGMVTYAKEGRVSTRKHIADIPFLDDRQKTFFRTRKRKFA